VLGNTMKKIRNFSTLPAAAALWCTAAVAHHSFAMFDMERKVEIQGVVAEVQWTNPHVWIEVDVPVEGGGTERWGVEFTSRVHMTRRGWTSSTVKAGDAVTFMLSPYHDGRPGGRFWTVTLPTGEVLRDPGAQREYELSKDAGELSVDPAVQPRGDADARRASAMQVNRANFGYAALEAWPDLRGIWHPSFGRVGGGAPKLKGEFLRTYEAVLAASAADPNYEAPERLSNCEPVGMPYMMTMPYSLEFLYTPGKITVQQEALMQLRRIFMDGRALPVDPEPTYFGYSVGRWEGGTLVVETVGTRPGQRLGIRGITNGPNLKITERIYLDPQDSDLLHLDFTYEDPDALVEPWQQTHTFRRDTQWEMLEYVCAENDRHPVNAAGATEAVLND
jgi:hypothetical protein